MLHTTKLTCVFTRAVWLLATVMPLVAVPVQARLLAVDVAPAVLATTVHALAMLFVNVTVAMAEAPDVAVTPLSVWSKALFGQSSTNAMDFPVTATLFSV